MSSRKYSYASVREQYDEDTPQSFKCSPSSQNHDEVSWIAGSCSERCRTTGLCSYHSGGTHEDYVQTRLDSYARNNPQRLHSIVEELEKRKRASRLSDLSVSSRKSRGHRRHSSDYSLELRREHAKVLDRVRHTGQNENEDALSISDDGDEVGSLDSSSQDSIFDESEASDIATTDDELHLSEFSPPKKVLAPFETLPAEILDQIFSYVTVDFTTNSYSHPHADLLSCSSVSKIVNASATRVMYQHISILQSKFYSHLMRSLKMDPNLGQLIRCLDFSHYAGVGYGISRSIVTKLPYLTPETLKTGLELMPNLNSFLVHEHVDDELDVEVISKLFQMPSIQSLDFCACSSKQFTEAFDTVCQSSSSSEYGAKITSLSSLKRLSLHECMTLPESVFENLLPRLANLTHLDAAHTQISVDALMTIPKSARISHLNLQRCAQLDASDLVTFLTCHEAVKDSLVYLNISAEPSTNGFLTEDDLLALLPTLPRTLKSLNLGSSNVTQNHIPYLQCLATHVEELGLRGAKLDLHTDINRIFGLNDNKRTKKTKATLRYIDLSDNNSITSSDLASNRTILTSTQTQPLEVIELSRVQVEDLKKRNARAKNPEWVVRELGRRGWLVRQHLQSSSPAEGDIEDDGSREWKMGARWWGMRKIPMVDQRVGGMYGYFMFKRN